MSEANKEIIVNINENQTIIELSEIIQPFKSEIFIKKMFRGNVHEINLKSFLGLITINLQNKDRISVRAVGDDCEDALQAVVKYLTRNDAV